MRARLVLMLPVIVLLAVAGAALLGQDPRAGNPSRAVPLTQLPSRNPSTTAPPGASTAPTPVPAAIPDELLGLAIQDVASARRDALERIEPERLVAVSGWLTIAPGDPRCETNWYLACRRAGRLTSSRESDAEVLIVQTQPGVPLIGLQRQSPAQGTWTIHNRAVLVGRFGEPGERACRLPSLDCEPVFTVERLVWLRSTFRARPVAIGPGAIRAETPVETAEATARAGLTTAGATLLVGVLDRASLDLLDPVAAAAVSDHPADAVVWYLRAIMWPDGEGVGDPQVGWSLVDDRTGQLLATAPPPVASGTVGTRH
jgi:hypothetical protein